MKQKQQDNYLDRKPKRIESIRFTLDDAGMVTLLIDNKGFFNRLAQKFFKKPAVSYIHLDELGSFIWPLLDGEKTVFTLGEAVEAQFGEKAHPLYERLVKFFQILESYHFIEWA